MKNVFSTLALTILSSAAHASDVDVVRAGCEALTTPAQRSACHAAVGRLMKPQSAKPSNPKGTSDGAIRAAKDQVLSMLNDPESARFRSAAISSETNAVCGVVNAKNAMGGYGSPMRFIVTQDRTYLETSDNRAAIDYRWLEACPDL